MALATLVASALVLAGATPDGDTRPEDAAAIVVTARNPLGEKRVGEAVRRLGRHADAGGDQFQVPRWLDPVCPVILGLQPRETRQLDEMIHRVAAQVGAPVVPSPCQRNVQIMFSETPQTLLADAAAHESSIFRGMSKPDRKALLDSGMPIRWGSVTITRNADGRPLDNGVASGISSTRLGLATASGVGRLFIMVDTSKLAPADTFPVFAYVTFVTLAPLNPGSPPAGVDTILSWTPGRDSDRSRDLQPFDVAYLKALYLMPQGAPGHAQQSEMIRTINRLLRK